MVEFDFNLVWPDIKTAFINIWERIKHFDAEVFVHKVRDNFAHFIEWVKHIDWNKVGNSFVGFFKHPDFYLKKWYAASLAYFSSLTQKEVYGWTGEGIGFVLIIVAIILM